VFNQSTVPQTISYVDPVTKARKEAPFKFSACFPGFTKKLSEFV
jgi:hypothetical protein